MGRILSMWSRRLGGKSVPDRLDKTSYLNTLALDLNLLGATVFFFFTEHEDGAYESKEGHCSASRDCLGISPERGWPKSPAERETLMEVVRA